MRLLSEEEKELCKIMLQNEGKHNYIGNLIDHKLGGVCIEYNLQNSTLKLLANISNSQNFSNEEFDSINSHFIRISNLILTTANLIKLLESEGYIMLIQRAGNLQSQSKFGNCIGNMDLIGSDFPDVNVSKIFIEYLHKDIVVTDEFRDFIKHNFIPRDERRFRRQNLNSMIALTLAFLGIAYNVYNGIVTNKNSKLYISDMLKEVTNRLDSVIYYTKHFKNQKKSK